MCFALQVTRTSLTLGDNQSLWLWVMEATVSCVRLIEGRYVYRLRKTFVWFNVSYVWKGPSLDLVWPGATVGICSTPFRGAYLSKFGQRTLSEHFSMYNEFWKMWWQWIKCR